MFKDYYALLGIARNASPQEIKSAYRRRAAEYHPDKVATADPVMILEINEAMAVLGDLQRKAKYDYDLSFIPERPGGGAHERPGAGGPERPSQAFVPERAPQAPPRTTEPAAEPPATDAATFGAPIAAGTHAPPPNAAPALRSATILMRLRALPMQFTELKWPGWSWSLKSAGKHPLVIAYRQIETMNPQVLQALEKSIDAGSANTIVLLTCRRIDDRARLLKQLDEATKKKMLILYDELGNRGVRFGKPPEHEYAGQILKILMAA